MREKNKNNKEYQLDNTVNKLVLLFVMEKMEIPLTENSIMDICTSRNDWLKYIDCKENISQLLDAKLIYIPEPHQDEPLYALTYEGQNCLSLFFQNIPITLRDEISEFAKLNIQHIKRNQEYVSNYTKMADGSYLTTFTIRDPHLQQALFEIKIKMESRSQAISACKRWIDKAPDIYESVFIGLIAD